MYRSVREFCRFTSQDGLLDLGVSGLQVTWCNNQDPVRQVFQRLDIALANDDWVKLFPDDNVTVLPYIASCHSPLLVNLSKDAVERGAKTQERVF